jgi:hypothetical protein
MTLQRKIHILVFACLLLFSGVAMFLRRIQIQQNDLFVNSSVVKLQEIVSNSVNVQSSQLRQVVTDYTNWDSMIDHMSVYDKKWSDNSIATIINSYKLNSLIVCNLDHKVMYTYGAAPSEVLGSLPDQKHIFSQLDGHKFFHFYRKTPDGILEISGATIHPTKDSARITPRQGYFILSKLWNKKFFSDLPFVQGTVVSIESADFRATNSTDKNVITTALPLFDFNQKAICTLVVKEPNKFLESYHDISLFIMNFMAFMILFVLVILFLVLFLLVRRPLKLITETLKRNDTRPLKLLLKSKDEFSQIAELIMKFHDQRKELESENAERRIAQQELAQNSELMSALADASSRLHKLDDLGEALKIQ